MAVDGVQGEMLPSLWNVVALTHAGFYIASYGSPWRETQRERDDQVWLLFWFARASKLGYGEDEVCKRLL